MRLVVLDNQCTGNPAYAGEQDNDPVNNTDCVAGSDTINPLLTPPAPTVKAAEFQVYTSALK